MVKHSDSDREKPSQSSTAQKSTPFLITEVEIDTSLDSVESESDVKVDSSDVTSYPVNPIQSSESTETVNPSEIDSVTEFLEISDQISSVHYPLREEFNTYAEYSDAISAYEAIANPLRERLYEITLETTGMTREELFEGIDDEGIDLSPEEIEELETIIKWAHLKRGNTIIRSGISNDPDRREKEHQQEYGLDVHIYKVGRATTRDAARDWEKQQRKGTP